MKKNNHFYSLFYFLCTFFFFQCAKFEPTQTGGSIMDDFNKSVNIRDTFIEVYAQTFLPVDTTRSFFVFNSSNNNILYSALGKIKDADFGTKESSLYFSLQAPDTTKSPLSGTNITLDSIVLRMRLNDFAGDTLSNFNINVYPLTENPIEFSIDAAPYFFTNSLKYNSGEMLGKTAFNYTNPKSTSYPNQVSIPISLSYGNSILNLPAESWTSWNNFKKVFKGFAVIPDEFSNPYNVLLNVNLVDTGTYFALYYRSKETGVDTFSSKVLKLTFGSSCGFANHIKWDKNNANINKYLTDEKDTSLNNQEFVFLQNNYISAIRIAAPALKTLPANMVVHKAELVLLENLQQKTIHSINMKPDFAFLFIDSNFKKYGSVPLDYINGVNYDEQYLNFGGYKKDTINANKEKIASYRFNISRYVQAIINKKSSYYPFVIEGDNFAPFQNTTIVYNQIMQGQIRLEGGTKDKNKLQQKMHIRIVGTW